MDEIKKCVDCNRRLIKMDPLARRCKNCRKRFEERVDLNLKKKK